VLAWDVVQVDGKKVIVLYDLQPDGTLQETRRIPADARGEVEFIETMADLLLDHTQ